jgi:hypothetical protein
MGEGWLPSILGGACAACVLLSTAVATSASAGAFLGAPRPIETMFYTSQTAYPAVPDRDAVASLIAGGYRVVVCDTPGLRGDQRGWPDVEYAVLTAPPDTR